MTAVSPSGMVGDEGFKQGGDLLFSLRAFRYCFWGAFELLFSL